MLRLASILTVAMLLACGPLAAGRKAQAQQLIGLSDEIILLSKGQTKKRQAKQQSAAGAAPGAGENPFLHEPGGRGRGLEQHADPSRSTVHFRGGSGSALSSISAPPPQIIRSSAPLGATRPQMKAEALPPLYGPLELPPGDVEGPPDGLTLDQAIERLVRFNPDLRAKSYEIPQARADVITAGLRGNPFYFLSGGGYPYAPYSQTRPGGTNYGVTVVQPVDLNHKRRARADAARAAVNVLEAQYQNAVRLAIDDLYNTFLDVVVARETIRYAEASLAGSAKLLETAEVQLQAGAITEPDYLNIAIQHDAAAIGLDRAQTQYQQARHALGMMLAFPPEMADQLEVRGLIRDTAPPPPNRDELVRTALNLRPDVAAFRLGIARAQADLRVNRKEVIEDVFVIYSPYQTQSNQAIGGQTANSFSFGLLGTIPLFNRNQGDIRRAQYNVTQTRVGLAAAERQAIAEVDRALLEYQASRKSAERLEKVILPHSERARQGVIELFRHKEKSGIDVLEAQRQHNEFVRQYRDAVIAHRRAMLRLNTVVGQRVLP
ncbi:MAG TPA: TolC family protein [Pirellulales bacterium]|nr:TolC family protein [Pirellulales bacterium]